MKFHLPDECINDLQVKSIARMIDLLKDAHKTDVIVESRMGGRDVRFQADWIKHLVLEKSS